MFPGEEVQIFAIEPTYELILQELLPKFANEPRVKIFPLAIDIENSFKKFNIAGQEDWGCSSLHEFSKEGVQKWSWRTCFKYTHSYFVPTMTLKDFCKLYGIEKIDYLWIDTQGNDFNVLKSLEEMIDVVVEGKCETSDHIALYENTENHKDIVSAWLENHGFSIEIDSNGPEADIKFKKNRL
jgi:FkbM family methyltransferase